MLNKKLIQEHVYYKGLPFLVKGKYLVINEDEEISFLENQKPFFEYWALLPRDYIQKLLKQYTYKFLLGQFVETFPLDYENRIQKINVYLIWDKKKIENILYYDKVA